MKREVGRDWSDVLTAKECLGLSELEEAREASFLEPSEGARPAASLISDF